MRIPCGIRTASGSLETQMLYIVLPVLKDSHFSTGPSRVSELSRRFLSIGLVYPQLKERLQARGSRNRHNTQSACALIVEFPFLFITNSEAKRMSEAS